MTVVDSKLHDDEPGGNIATVSVVFESNCLVVTIGLPALEVAEAVVIVLFISFQD